MAKLLAREEDRFRGEILDAGGGGELFARSLPSGRLTSIDASNADAASFDAVLSISRLQFAGDPAADVVAMARACKPGGAVLILVPHALQEDLAEALHAFTLRGLHALASAAGLDVEYTRAVNPSKGGVLRRELDAFEFQSPKHIAVPDELCGWVDVMDEQRPMLLACLGIKRE